MPSHSIEWLFSVALLCLAGCSAGEAPLQLSGSTMGTTWHVTIVADDDTPPPAQLQQGIEAVLESVNDSMSTYRPESEISRINRSPVDTWIDVSAPVRDVLSVALTVGSDSNGGYDVTVGPLVDLWGFGPAGSVPEPPDDALVQEVLASVGQDMLELDTAGLKMRKLGPVSLDFSSIAKGYAVDRVALWLHEQGVGRFLAEVGGELKLSGTSARNDPWRIAIEQPDSGMRGVAQAISLSDAAVATSGDYRNFFQVDGKRYSHTLDPRTGYPVMHDLVSVTVVHPSAMQADAWATALTVLGADEAREVALAMRLAVYFIQRDGEAFSSSYTPAFERYLHGEQSVPTQQPSGLRE